jgi:hypothetical protein
MRPLKIRGRAGAMLRLAEKGEREKAARAAVARAAAAAAAEGDDKAAAEAAAAAAAAEAAVAKAEGRAATQATCPNIDAIERHLQNIGITSYEYKKTTTSDPKSDMQRYDKWAKTTYVVENAIRLLHFAGCAIPLISSVADVTLALVTGISSINHSRALTFLASKCLSYVANISKDLAIMKAFYGNYTVKKNRITIDAKLYDELEKNLYTFLYFLIDSITFEITRGVREQHYLYWRTFLSKVDFNKNSDYNSAIPPTKYRYSCIECIPSESLRARMRNKLDKKHVALENPAQSSSKTKELAFYGYCNDDVLMICKNYNDNIMRLIEVNMYTLIKSAHTNRNMIPILKHSEKTLSDDFSNAVFSITQITKDIRDKFENRFKQQIPSAIPTSRAAAIAKSLSSERVIKKYEPDLVASFEFLIELNRIIFELGYNDFTDKKVSMTKTVIAGITTPVGLYFSQSKIKYEELLREYTLMIGNFLMITSSFTLHNNELTAEDRETVRIALEKKLGGVLDGALNNLENGLTSLAVGIGDRALTLTDDGNGTGDDNQTASVVGGRNLSKKKYKCSPKCKTKHNKRKRHAF